MYRHSEHQADIAIEVESDSLEELFQDALTALIEISTGITGQFECVIGRLVPFAIDAKGADNEELLVDLLSELLFAAQTLRWGPRTITSLNLVPDTNVSATILGLPEAGGEHLAREIKAVTYHDLKITRLDKWRVRIVFDV